MKSTPNQQASRPSTRACFELAHPNARSVIAGSFNHGDRSRTPVVRLGEVLWLDDPAAKETVPNPFGGINAALEVRPAAPHTLRNS